MTEYDEIPCAVLLRKKPSHEWEFIHYTTKKSVAWRSANMLRQDELDNGFAKAQAIVVLRSDYDAGRLRPIKPPKDFDLNLPVSTEPLLQTPEQMAEEQRRAAAPEPTDKPEGEVLSGLRRLLQQEDGSEATEVQEPASETEPESKPKPKPRRRQKGQGLDL